MTSLSDTLTVGLVLVLLFGAVCLYLYTRIQQAEQKITLLESILLDLKMSAEFSSYSELPADEQADNRDDDNAGSDTVHTETATANVSYTPFEEDHEEVVTSSPVPAVEEVNDVNEYRSAVASVVQEDLSTVENSDSKQASVSYDSMTLKELQALAKTRGIVGASTMKKGPIMEALKTSDKVQSAEGITGMSSSFLQTSSVFPSSESN